MASSGHMFASASSMRFGMVLVHMAAQIFQKLMSFRKVLAIGAFPFVQIRNCIEPKAVHTHFGPVIERREK